MKTATYSRSDGSTFEVEYDEMALCLVCNYPVRDASVGGTSICPSCDVGKCPHCDHRPLLYREEIDGGKSIARFRQHIRKHDYWLIFRHLSLVASLLGLQGSLVVDALTPLGREERVL